MFVTADKAECRDGMVSVETALIEHQQRAQTQRATSQPFIPSTGQVLDRYQSEEHRESANTFASPAPAVAGLTG